jgi:hypothetical protein
MKVLSGNQKNISPSRCFIPALGLYGNERPLKVSMIRDYLN